MKVCVQGLWHLGAVTAACAATLGNDVCGLDFEPGVAESLGRGKPPVFEPGLEEAVGRELAAGRLRFSSDGAAVLRDAEVLWVAYDTPVDDDDVADVDFVVTRVERSMPLLRPGGLVLVSSQLPVGSIARLERTALGRYPDRHLEFACCPENLRLGRAIDAFLDPDRIVVGVRSQQARNRVGVLFQRLAERVEWMSVESAEMTKHALNAFLATSVTFANELATLCEAVGADAKEVERGLRTEHRIGRKAYLAPGAAFAGGTLARDVAYLNGIGAGSGLSTPLLSSIKASNDAHRDWVRRRLVARFPRVAAATVAIWGLAYKPGTDTLRRSMAVELCTWLLAHGARVAVYDAHVGALPEAWGDRIRRVAEPLEALRGAGALVVFNDTPEQRRLSAGDVTGVAPGLVVLDPNRYMAGWAGQPDLTYVSVGTPGAPA